MVSRAARQRPRLLCGILLLLTGCGGDAGSDSGEGVVRERTIPVLAEPVVLEAERRQFEAVGTSRAVHSVDLFAQSSGEVESVNFTGGEWVKAGQLLLALDAEDEKLAVELAEVNLEQAETLLQRYVTARGADAVPPITIDSARAERDAARITLDRARVALEDRYVRALFDGVVGITDFEPGSRIDPSMPITSLDDRSELLVRFDVPEAFINRIAAGDVIEVESWTADRLHASGPVESIDSRINPATRAFQVRARVPNAGDQLRPGMSFRVLLSLDGAVWPVVPEVSLQWSANGAYVWAVREGRAERVEVHVIQRREGRVLLDADLPVGELVVTEGVQRMRQGAAVRLLDKDALSTDPKTVLEAAAR